MMEGFIRRLDPETRTISIESRDGRELTVKLPESANIEVVEHSSMGTTGGKFADLGLGYLVQLELHDVHENGTCHCSSLVCIS